ncbi:hypothetical protein D3C87_638530 [compost metagenome]
MLFQSTLFIAILISADSYLITISPYKYSTIYETTTKQAGDYCLLFAMEMRDWYKQNKPPLKERLTSVI